MAFRKMRFREPKKLFTGVACIGFGAFFLIHGFIYGFTTSKIIFGALLLYFGFRSIALAK